MRCRRLDPWADVDRPARTGRPHPTAATSGTGGPRRGLALGQLAPILGLPGAGPADLDHATPNDQPSPGRVLLIVTGPGGQPRHDQRGYGREDSMGAGAGP